MSVKLVECHTGKGGNGGYEDKPIRIVEAKTDTLARPNCDQLQKLRTSHMNNAYFMYVYVYVSPSISPCYLL